MKKTVLNRIVMLVSLMSLFLSCERDLDNLSGDDYNDGDDKNSEYYENPDDYKWDSGRATIIVMEGDDAEISGQGATFSDGQILIDTIGEYWIQGELYNGQIVVRAGDSQKVKLILDNVTIHCNDNSPVFVEGSERTVIILAENSVNSISDGSTYASDERNAAIYSKSDLVLYGNGKLNIEANYKDGICSKDGMIIHSGEYEITAPDDGIRGKDYLVIRDGTFNISSGGDAILSDNEDPGCGYLDVYDGNFSISSEGDGLYAYNEIYVEAGTFNIFCSSGNNSGKAVKAGSLITIAGGEFKVQSTDDAFHSDLDLLVKSGTFTITTGDDAFHAENEMTIIYADILIKESYEGLEAKNLTIVDGNITLTSSDDGLNTASGAGASQGGMQPGSPGDNNLFIEGGTVIIHSRGDGIDINGSVEMSGGTLLIHGPTSNGDGAIDYDGSFQISGGTIVAAGSSGMAQVPGSSSSQYSVLINYSTANPASTLFHLQDAAGGGIITFRPEINYQSVALSSPDLVKGSSYSIYTGGNSTGIESGGLYMDGEYSPGNLYTSFTISSITTTIGNQGGGRPGW